MGYEDFCAFYISEEDKSNETALRFWFGVLDVDGDGVLSPADLRHFYREQAERMTAHGVERVAFSDILCQFADLLQPSSGAGITLDCFLHPTRIKLTGVLFAALTNVSKFTAFEQRDPLLCKQTPNFELSQFDRFAAREYARLSVEEEQSQGAVDGVEGFGL